MNPFKEIDALLAAGRDVVLARIVRQVGSSPRSLGTACLVMPDGAISGTIGGGLLEHQVVAKAKEVAQARRSALLSFRMTGKEVAQTDMLCGGLVDVHLELISHEDPVAKALMHEAAAILSAAGGGAVATRIEANLAAGQPGLRALIRSDGSITGDLFEHLPGHGLDPAGLGGTGRPTVLAAETSHGRIELFLEPLRPEPVLYIFGAGHISTFVAPLAKMVGFRVVIIDDRDEFANPDRFPQADDILVCGFTDAFGRIDTDGPAFIAVITRGHIHDHAVLRSALQTPAAYIGMVGSRRKRDMIYQSLVDEGVSPDRLAQVHSPIGLSIGAETPEEIAVSIVAELIRVRAIGEPVPKQPFKCGTGV